jgi:hypothetical protein
LVGDRFLEHFVCFAEAFILGGEITHQEGKAGPPI